MAGRQSTPGLVSPRWAAGVPGAPRDHNVDHGVDRRRQGAAAALQAGDQVHHCQGCRVHDLLAGAVDM
eukprot:153479-Prorocentrum_minimum.AAC.1